MEAWWMLAAATVAGMAMAAGAAPSGAKMGRVETWPAPQGEATYGRYAVTVNGKPVAVHACRVSAVPINQVWPGYQRPMDQTELAGFACWGMSGPVRVVVTATEAFGKVVVRPLARNVKPRVRGREVSFTLDRPGQVTVEFDGRHNALHLFADPLSAAPPAPAANVRYFGPGVHHPGKIDLKSGETLYIAGGAVVHTAVDIRNATGVRILGRGIIDASEYERDKGGGCIRITDSSDITIDGVVLRDPDVWCLAGFGVSRVRISNVKLVGLWRYNADGIDMCNCQDVEISHSFVRAFDDAVVLKGLFWGPNGYDKRPVKDVRIHDMVVWCDWGHALEIGAETSAPEFTNVRYTDCDVIRATHSAMDIQCGDRAVVHDIAYTNIRMELDDVIPNPRLQNGRDDHYVEDPADSYRPLLCRIHISSNPYSQDKERGRVHDITYTNVSVTGNRPPASWLHGCDTEHDISKVAFIRLKFNGKPILDARAGCFSIDPFVGEVRFGEK